MYIGGLQTYTTSKKLKMTNPRTEIQRAKINKKPTEIVEKTRFNKNKKIRKTKTLLVIALVLMVCFLIFAVILTIDSINAQNQNHSAKTIYYNPDNTYNNQKKLSQPCPCSG